MPERWVVQWRLVGPALAEVLLVPTCSFYKHKWLCTKSALAVQSEKRSKVLFVPAGTSKGFQALQIEAAKM